MWQGEILTEHHTTDTTAGTGTAAHTHLMHGHQGADNYVAEPSMQISWTSTNIHTWLQKHICILTCQQHPLHFCSFKQSPHWFNDRAYSMAQIHLLHQHQQYISIKGEGKGTQLHKVTRKQSLNPGTWEYEENWLGMHLLDFQNKNLMEQLLIVTDPSDAP